MGKKYIITIAVACILGIGCLIGFGNRNEMQIYSEKSFCFDGIPIGFSEELFLEEHKEATLFEERQGAYAGEEHIYVKEFISPALKQKVAAYYYFDESGFQRGIYEIRFDEKEIMQVFDSAYNFLGEKLSEANEEIHFEMDNFKGRFLNAWENLQAYEEIFYSDNAAHILRLGYYILLDSVQKQHVLEVEIYRQYDWQELIGNTHQGNGWPQEIEPCWNVEADGNDSQKRADLSYSKRMRLIRFAADEVWAINPENGELMHYEVSDDCKIWALLDPASYGKISFDLLVKSEQNVWVRDWIIGTNAQGEIEHTYEAMIP